MMCLTTDLSEVPLSGLPAVSQRPRLVCWVGGWEWATALVARVVLTSPPTPSPWAWAEGGWHPRRLLERLVGHLAALLFLTFFRYRF